jgi:hypothetical protein
MRQAIAKISTRFEFTAYPALWLSSRLQYRTPALFLHLPDAFKRI